MARIRTVKPEFFYSEQVTSVSMTARVFFIGLWTLADREGRLQWAPRKLKAQLFPFDDGVSVEVLADELIDANLLQIYGSSDAEIAWIPGFAKHQRPHPKEPKSELPECPPKHVSAPRNLTKPCKETAGHVSIPSSPVGREGDLVREGVAETAATTTTERSPSLVRSMSPWNEWQGQRLEVPRKWHDDHVKKLGGASAPSKLVAWYAKLDAQLVQSPQTPVKNWFRYLDACYASWVPDDVSAKDAALDRRGDAFLEKVAALEAGR